ncbi:Putative uncharacterized protein [Moritella viscosa]|uniref:Uncharacterized protein n=1 Tax=Moritella viscosa TaxID=80854 RepID=A0A090IFB9_9GAMM|nr:hypothetical protein [Moritella viscosa]CED59507.1 putative lipoprotein [Moritella viscosa]SGY88114.1 Putative uncharacterized protein [Moritella viscosa]SGY88246.1 Putative uncharacterized protein [Moritella viscosa]SGY90092.1 Putative uncharacterized protein [Moritella viscosa]SHO01941.1 Putative uncharacterized protein [Moritella viscosa]
MKKTPLMFFMTSILLAGCGSGDSSPGGNASNSGAKDSDSSTPPTPAVFSDTIIPAGFNWEMRNSKLINFKHVSTISQGNGAPLSISGKHYIEIYSIDANNKPSATPFLKAMTNRRGEAKLLLTLLNSWKGITVKTQLDDSVCINTLYKEQITATQALGCDVVLDSDLL